MASVSIQQTTKTNITSHPHAQIHNSKQHYSWHRQPSHFLGRRRNGRVRLNTSTCSGSQPTHNQHTHTHLRLATEAVLSNELKLLVETLLLERTTGTLGSLAADLGGGLHTLHLTHGWWFFSVWCWSVGGRWCGEREREREEKGRCSSVEGANRKKTKKKRQRRGKRRLLRVFRVLCMALQKIASDSV